MRGTGVGNVVAQNMAASSAKRSHEKWMRSQKKMCWKCQKDKPQYGGHAQTLDGFGGMVHKFICRDCIEAKQRSLKVEE